MEGNLKQVNVKGQNIGYVFQKIYHAPGITRSQLTQETGLSLPTISNHVKLLNEKGIITEEKLSMKVSIGRKSSGLFPNSEAYYSLGMEITQHSVKVIMLDFCGNVVDRLKHIVPFSASDEYEKLLSQMLEQLLDDHHIDRSRVVGVGIAITARVIEEKKQLTSYILGIDHYDVNELTKYISYPTVMMQIAYGSVYNRIRSNSNKNMLYIWIGEVLSAAFVLNENIYHGEHRLGMELNHLCMEKNGRLHNCGRRGCLGAYCSSVALAEHFNGDLDRFFEALESQNPIAVNDWVLYVDMLSLAISNVSLLTDTSVIVGGPVGRHLVAYTACIEAHISQINPYWEQQGGLLVDTEEDSTAIGSAQKVLSEFVSNLQL